MLYDNTFLYTVAYYLPSITFLGLGIFMSVFGSNFDALEEIKKWNKNITSFRQLRFIMKSKESQT
jgi:hypothetical protein